MDLFLVGVIVAAFTILVVWLWLEYHAAYRGWERASRGWEEAIEQRDMLLDVLAEGQKVETDQPKLRAVE